MYSFIIVISIQFSFRVQSFNCKMKYNLKQTTVISKYTLINKSCWNFYLFSMQSTAFRGQYYWKVPKIKICLHFDHIREFYEYSFFHNTILCILFSQILVWICSQTTAINVSLVSSSQSHWKICLIQPFFFIIKKKSTTLNFK